MKRKVLIALQTFCEYNQEPLKLLQNAGIETVLNRSGHRLKQEEIIKLGNDCEGIIAGVEPYDKSVLDNLFKLKCISRCGVGIDNIDLGVAREKRITILNTPDIVVQPVAEMTIAMIFDLLRLLTPHTNLLKTGVWKKRVGHLLSGRKVGIMGLGRIGKKVAQMLVSLRADVYSSDLMPDLEWAKENNVKILSTSELLGIVDILSLHVSVLKDNTFFLGKSEISQLKKGAIIINTSRGQIIDEDALYEALRSGHLGGAGLDVFQNEPYTGRLCELENVVLTPHISTLTEESRAEMEKQAVLNILIFFNP